MGCEPILGFPPLFHIQQKCCEDPRYGPESLVSGIRGFCCHDAEDFPGVLILQREQQVLRQPSLGTITKSDCATNPSTYTIATNVPNSHPGGNGCHRFHQCVLGGLPVCSSSDSVTIVLCHKDSKWGQGV